MTSNPTPSALPTEIREAKLNQVLGQIARLNRGLASPEVKPDPLGRMLEDYGLTPANSRKVIAQMRARYGPAPAQAWEMELDRADQVLRSCWRDATENAHGEPSRVHVFIGTPGVGKTTCLSKWLAQETLFGDRTAQVWRLDGHAANNAESLSIYAEVLKVPVHRAWPDKPPTGPDLHFVDLPGLPARDLAALQNLAARLEVFGQPQIHLVLNANYETRLWLNQIEKYRCFSLASLVVSYLDEEEKWGRLWNLVLGTNCVIQYFSAGQNVPGDFRLASAALLPPVGSRPNACA